MNNREFCNRSRNWLLYSSAAIVLAAMQGCASSGTRPEEMSAEAHRAAAIAEGQEIIGHLKQNNSEEWRAKQRIGTLANSRVYYNPNAYSDPYNPYYDYFWDLGSYNPRVDHLDSVKLLEGHAADHLAAAQVLETFEEAECRAFPPQTRATSPLIGQVESAVSVFGGVGLSFKEGIDVNAAIAHMRCHVAFAGTRGRIGMKSCPLYIPGIKISRGGNSNVVELLVGEQSQLVDLRQRVQEHLGLTEL